MSALAVALLVLLFCALLCLYRIGAGPTAPDRTVAIDILGTLIVGFCCIYALFVERDFFMNVAIAWALLSFIGTIALAKYLEGKAFDE
jgi:multicomponent Na+:H+ antiporter subunit F